MLRLQTVVESTLFPRKKSPRLEKLSKPPQRASKLASFDTVLAVRTLAVTFFFLRRTCSCRLSASLSSYLTWHLIMLVLSNNVLQPNKKAFRQPSIGDVAVLHAHPGSIECQTTACAGACIDHSAGGALTSAVELVLVWTRICVSIMVFSLCFEFGHVVLDLFSPLPTRSPCRKYAWQQPTSIVDISAQEPCRFFSRKAGQLWTLNKQPLPIFTSRRGKKHPNKRQTNDQTKVSPQVVVDRSSALARPDRDRGQRCSAATFPSNSKYRYRPLTQPDVANCWPCARSDPIHTKWSNSHEVIQAKLKKFHTKWSNSHEVIQSK